MKLTRLFAGMRVHRGAGGANDLALLYRLDSATLFAHLKQIGSNELVANQFRIGNGQGRIELIRRK